LDDIDFSDPAALMRRQRKILERIQKHQAKTNFDPLRILRSKVVTWMVILCHGGKFVVQVYENDNMIFNKTESKYVCRGKQGGRQLNADRHKKISSMGSDMRRENEKLLQLYIISDLEEVKDHIVKSSVIFLHAPGFNKNLLIQASKHLQKCAHKVRSIEYKSSKANFQEAKDLVDKILNVNIYFKE